MQELIGCILCGLLNLMILSKMLSIVKKKDKDIFLPKKIRNEECFFIFLCGAVSFQGICIDTIIFFLLSVYLSFMSYTDYYTRKVYSAFSHFISFIGIFYFIANPNWIVNITWLVLCFVIILVGYSVKAYAGGDVEIYMALTPYYIGIFFEGTFLLLYCLTLLTAVLTSIKLNPIGIKKTKAMAPVITFVHFLLMVSHLLYRLY